MQEIYKVLSSNIFSKLSLLNFNLFDLDGSIPLAPKKFKAADDLIPKLIPSDISLPKPETAIAINSPPSPTIGPPLFPRFYAGPLFL